MQCFFVLLRVSCLSAPVVRGGEGDLVCVELYLVVKGEPPLSQDRDVCIYRNLTPKVSSASETFLKMHKKWPFSTSLFCISTAYTYRGYNVI